MKGFANCAVATHTEPERDNRPAKQDKGEQRAASASVAAPGSALGAKGAPMNNPKAQQWLTRADGLATRLRQLRGGRSGLSLAKQFDWNSSKITRIEAGEQVPKPSDVEKWARACGASDVEIADLLKLLAEFDAVRGMFKRRTKEGATPAQTDGSALLETATLTRTYSLAVLPAIVQLPEYARAVFEEGERVVGDGPDIDEAVAARMRRTQLIHDPSRRFEMVLDESVLYRRRGNHEDMSAQLDRLLPLGSTANVRLGIVPLDAPVTVPAIQGFTVYDDAVMLETFHGDQRAPDEDTPFYTSMLADFWDAALEGRNARKLILKAIDNLGD